MSAPREPRTRSEWQEAVDAAHACLLLDSARQYGLVEGGPTINADRCMAILREGKKRKVEPSPDAIERLILAMVLERGEG